MSGYWLVTFSPVKTKSMTISNKANARLHPELYLNGHAIERVDHHKYFGITLSHNLRWNYHIDNLLTASSKKLDIMRALKYKLDRRSL